MGKGQVAILLGPRRQHRRTNTDCTRLRVVVLHTKVLSSIHGGRFRTDICRRGRVVHSDVQPPVRRSRQPAVPNEPELILRLRSLRVRAELHMHNQTALRRLRGVRN